MIRKLKVAFLAFSLLALAACGSARRSEPIAGPFNASLPGVAGGEKVFMHYCFQCHPGGEAGLGPALNNKPLPVFLMKFQVRHGLGAMPSFPKEVLEDSELDNLTTYLVALRHH